MRKTIQKLLSQITIRRTAILFTVLFILSMLPMVYISFFDYATGDDLGFGGAAHRVIVNGGSLQEFVSVIIDGIITDYYSFQGNWSSGVLVRLMPSIWGERFYIITPFLGFFFLLFGPGLFLYELIVRFARLPKTAFIAIHMLFSLFLFQYLPTPRAGFYWYTGMIAYTGSFFLAILSAVFSIRFLYSGKKFYLFLCILFMTYLGGAAYPAMTFSIALTLVLICAALVFGNKTHKKRGMYLILPTVIEFIGFLVCLAAPGNKSRGGEDFGMTPSRLIGTLFLAIKDSFTDAIRYFITIRPLIFLTIILFFIAYELYEPKEDTYSFRYPAFFTLLCFLIYASTHAPVAFTGTDVGSGISGGVYNTYYFVFLCSMSASIIYCACSLKARSLMRPPTPTVLLSPNAWRISILAGVLFCLVFFRYIIGNTVDYTCVNYITSGGLRDFQAQMEERLELLNDPNVTDVIVPEMNDYQGPLMHMAMVRDPENFVNSSTAFFYGKNSVIAVPREEFSQLQ